jgi:hypothetical protein
MISVMDDLITDYTASGIKEAGIWNRVNYGTREIVIVLLTNKRDTDIARYYEIMVAD